MTLRQVLKTVSETKYTIIVKLAEDYYDEINVDYLANNINRHARNLERIKSASLAKVTDIGVNLASKQLEIRCTLGE